MTNIKATPRFIAGLIALALCGAMTLGTGCDKEEGASEPGGEVTAKSLGIPDEKEAKKLYDKAKPEDCPTFAKELAAACGDVIDKRLDLPCALTLMELGIIQEQVDGKLFDVGDEANAKVASSMCGVTVRKLRAARVKAEANPGDGVVWVDECKELFATMKKDCVDKIPTGNHEAHCELTMRMLESAVRTKGDGEMACPGGIAQIKIVNQQ